MKTPIHNRILLDNRGTGIFRVENRSAEDEATIYLYDVIVSYSTFGGVSAIDFVREFSGIQAKTIHLRINSPGGEVFAAQAMAQAIRDSKAVCVAHIDGLAASCASWVAIACDETEISSGGMVMIHRAQTVTYGNASDLSASAQLLDKIDGILTDAYVKATGKDAEQIASWMAAETWFTANEAVANGFADRISESAPKNIVAWDLSAYANAPKVADAPAGTCSKPVEFHDHLRRRLALAESI